MKEAGKHQEYNEFPQIQVNNHPGLSTQHNLPAKTALRQTAFQSSVNSEIHYQLYDSFKTFDTYRVTEWLFFKNDSAEFLPSMMMMKQAKSKAECQKDTIHPRNLCGWKNVSRIPISAQCASFRVTIVNS